MLTYIVRRLLVAIPILLIISIIMFVMLNMLPGDPITAMVSPEISSEVIEVRREALGLNKPLYHRYFLWLKELLNGNMGYSMINGMAVSQRIIERAPASIKLMGASLLFSMLLGIPLGVISAVKRYSLLDFMLTIFGFFAISVPSFFLGLGAIYIFGLKLNLLPVGGMLTIGGANGILDHLRHLLLPTLVLGLMQVAVIMRYTRGSMLEVLSRDYITTARAKGVSELNILFKHALKNSLIPVVTVFGLSIPKIFGGAVITEQIFQWPGIGMLTINALNNRDYPVLMGINLIMAFLVVVGNLISDIMYAVLDPRIRYS